MWNILMTYESFKRWVPIEENIIGEKMREQTLQKFYP